MLFVEIFGSPSAHRRYRRTGQRRGGGRLFRDATARQPDRRLGLRPVAAAREPRRARKTCERGFAALWRRGRAAAAILVRLPADCATYRVLAGTALPVA